MSLKLTYISTKKEMSEKDEKYIVDGIISGTIDKREVMYKIKRPTKAILETLYSLCENQSDIDLVVDYTPQSSIKEIDNLDYISSLIRSDYDNFSKINFEKFRTPERVYDYARILTIYEAAVSYKASCIKNQNTVFLPKEDKEELEKCQFIIHDMRDSFDTANMILSGNLDPKCINFNKNPQEDSEPESI